MASWRRGGIDEATWRQLFFDKKGSWDCLPPAGESGVRWPMTVRSRPLHRFMA